MMPAVLLMQRAASAPSGSYARPPGASRRESEPRRSLKPESCRLRIRDRGRSGKEPEQGHEGTESGEAETDDPAQGSELGLVDFEGGNDGVAGHVADPSRCIVGVLGTEPVPAEGVQDREGVEISRKCGRGHELSAARAKR